ncbi:MAG: hypothetical protein ACK55I_03115, partial [bacterium]
VNGHGAHSERVFHAVAGPDSKVCGRADDAGLLQHRAGRDHHARLRQSHTLVRILRQVIDRRGRRRPHQIQDLVALRQQPVGLTRHRTRLHGAQRGAIGDGCLVERAKARRRLERAERHGS